MTRHSHKMRALQASFLTTTFLLISTSFTLPQDAKTEPTVIVEKVEKRDFANTSEFIGRIQAIERVEIQARITGTLLPPKFKEGENVAPEQLLYEIDPAPFQAEVDAKRAQLASAESTAQFAAVSDKRAQDLLRSNTGTQAAADARKAELAQAQSAVQIAAAALRISEITLGYTRITAPISGRAGRTAITEGNIVSPASGALTTIVKDDKVWAVFAPSQREILEYRKAAFDKQPAIRLKLADGSVYDKLGSVDYIDNTVDSNTDSQIIRAVFDNPDRLLVDGQTIRVLMEQPTDAPVLTVSQVALAADQTGIFVLVVDENQTVATRYIEIGQQRDGIAIVKEGLKEGDLVIVQGMQRVRNGMKVNAQQPEPRS